MSLTEGKLQNTLERGTRQGDPISVYLFIIVLKIVFQIIKETSNIEGLEIFRGNLPSLLTRMTLPFFLKILNLL